MRTIFVLFDSLIRNGLGCYGGTSIATPNFDRFARRAVTFDNHYVGSLPCMPARRDLHTGRLNFMHRSWGPLEPFDNSFPEQMRDMSAVGWGQSLYKLEALLATPKQFRTAPGA